MLGKRTVVRWTVAGLVAAALAGASGTANAFQASTDVDIVQLGPIITDVFLPQYSGPGTITSVVLSMSGISWAGIFYPYFLDEGESLTIPSQPVSWDVSLIPPEGGFPIADAGISTQFPSGSIPPCQFAQCSGELDILTPSVPFSASGSASDLSDFAGTGNVDLILVEDTGVDLDGLQGTVTETITTSVPEPSNWALMLAGFGLLGGALRLKRHHQVA